MIRVITFTAYNNTQNFTLSADYETPAFTLDSFNVQYLNLYSIIKCNFRYKMLLSAGNPMLY